MGPEPAHELRRRVAPLFRDDADAAVRGRLFTEADSTTAPGVAIVSETAARRVWPGKDPIGQRLREPTYRIGDKDAPPGAWQTVVGVVQDVRFRGLNDVRLDLYVPTPKAATAPATCWCARTARPAGSPPQSGPPPRRPIRRQRWEKW